MIINETMIVVMILTYEARGILIKFHIALIRIRKYCL